MMQAPLYHSQKSGSEVGDVLYTVELYESLAEEASEQLRKGMMVSARLCEY